ncbi:hypothetical protein DSO57_1006819 [Entomophthora muscae]|uniref:Uncharacterized protein n=1 Tax=Entomophthora muscae TaxID=34485 RepID=A0ACC2TVA6_9FUNG|nr:hypothetical protein DSO57_1006819 [Entomophthora muscae]
MLENLHSTIQGPVIDFPKFDIVLGLDWLQKNNPHIDWATSVLAIKCEGVNHQTYPDSVDQLLYNHVFVRITETFVRKRPDTSCITEILWEKSTVLKNPNDSLMTLLAALDNKLWLLKVWPPAKLPNQCKMTKICDQGTRIDANLNSSITQQPLDGFGRPNMLFEAKHQKSQSVLFLDKI